MHVILSSPGVCQTDNGRTTPRLSAPAPSFTHPIRSAKLIGNVPEVQRAIDAEGNDIDTWTGT